MMIDKNIIAESIEHYGSDMQTTVCMEECAELIQAISKQKRGKGDLPNLIEEMADVLICIEILKQAYYVKDEWIENWIHSKQARIKKRMRNGDAS